jgi:Asp-tRNA(Asn)/Glu-tRNA(Gln) amidotransferase A subunit family amidase
MTEPCDLSAVEARRLIGMKRLSPVELVESCITRIEEIDHAINAVVAQDFDGAREQAKRAEVAVMSGRQLGPLHGLPIGINDMQDAAGLR